MSALERIWGGRVNAPLAGGLEEEPLELPYLVFGRRCGHAVRGIVLLGEVDDDGVRLPMIRHVSVVARALR